MNRQSQVLELQAPSRALALVRRLAGPLWFRMGFSAVLEVAGRRSGSTLHVTLFPIEVDGKTYLLSQYGACNWVRNLRAAGRGELHRKGRRQTFRAIEVDGEERDRVIGVFEARVPRPFRRDYDQLPAAGDHPTFRLEPME